MLDGKISNAELMVWFEMGLAGAAVLGGVIWGLIKFLKRKSNKKDYFKSHSRIYETLTELRVKTDCARAQLVQFHNGEYFMDGISMRRKSLTHESLNGGVSGEADRKQNLQLSLFIPLMNIILEDSGKLVMTHDQPDTYCKSYMENSSVVSFMALPLKTKNEISGYLMIQWCSLSKSDDINEEECTKILGKSRDLINIQLSQQPKK
tara:strand:- start:8881 stop:9498 length:618 start_codon:yes stop_codon:yes gene_type:complete